MQKPYTQPQPNTTVYGKKNIVVAERSNERKKKRRLNRFCEWIDVDVLRIFVAVTAAALHARSDSI